MPIYSYRCRKCGEMFDLLVGVGTDEEEPKCGKCGSNDLEKLLTTFGVKPGGSGEGSCAAPT
jgi:putative FmdB family regulatory protein